jgi:uncharacterized repeat protein (TIGR03803 family)
MDMDLARSRGHKMLRLFAIAAFGVAALVGCARAVSPLPTQPAAAQSLRPHVRYRLIHSFGAAAGDGETPLAGLTLVNGLLYGTTYSGGASGLGTVFELSAAGEERVIFSFRGVDGAYPTGGLIETNGALSGTTRNGGTAKACSLGCGTVFDVHADGKESVLYSFRGGTDGAYPRANLVDVNGIRYGTTTGGGDAGFGSVFELEPSGVERIIHSFKSGKTDGAYPEGDLVLLNGVLYGTTRFGGPSRECASIGPGFEGCGTVFGFDISTGAERVVHAFDGADGAVPLAGLLALNGALYGVTEYGGTSTRCGTGKPSGCGTVFEIRPHQTERVVYDFAGGNDGASPRGGLIAVSGKLYGTTAAGGASSACGGGCGTVFELSALGVKRVLYNFGGLSDGARPAARLIDANGALYGTTTEGGASGKGTVFAITL